MENYQYWHNIDRQKVDVIISELTSKIMLYWKDDYNKTLPQSVFFADVFGQIIDCTVEAKISFVDEGFDVIQAHSFPGKLTNDPIPHDLDDVTPAHIDIELSIDESLFLTEYNTIYLLLIEILRHEAEHLLQDGTNWRPYKANQSGNEHLTRGLVESGKIDSMYYFLLETEIDANLQGFRLRSKKEKKPLGEVIDAHLLDRRLDTNQIEIIKDKWRQRSATIGFIPEF